MTSNQLANVQHAEVAPIEHLTPSAGGNAMRLVEWAEEASAAHRLASALVRTPFAGSWKGDVDGATAAILKGSEVGLTPVTALGAFDNIQGTPAPKAITLRALVQSHGHDLEIVEETDTRATARYRRNGQGEWQTTSFTIEDAQRMKLTGKDNWQKQPGNMLIARVTSKAARLVASDVILGIGYSAEEIRDERSFDDRPARSSQGSGLGAALAPQVTAEQVTEPSGAEGAPGVAAPVSEPATSAPESPLLDPRSSLAKAMFAAMRERGIDDKGQRLDFCSQVTGREITTSAELTEDEARLVLRNLDPKADQ